MRSNKKGFLCQFYIAAALLLLFILPTALYSVVGAAQIVAVRNGQSAPETKIILLIGEQVISEKKTDRCGMVLIPAEEGEYTLAVESLGTVIKKNIAIEAGKLVSMTGDLESESFAANSQPYIRYRPYASLQSEKGFQAFAGDLGGLVSYHIATPHGSIYLGFPYHAAVGETISWSAILVPAGGKQKDVQKNFKKLSEYTVRVDEQSFSLKNLKGWTLMARESAKIVILSKKGKTLIQIRAHLGLIPNGTAPAAPEGFFVDNSRTYFSTAGWPVFIRGRFDGIAENTQVLMGEVVLEVKSETLQGIIVNPPANMPGVFILRITEGGETAECSVRNLHIVLEADSYDLFRGQSTRLRLKVLGLAGLEKPCYVSLVNQTVSIVNMSGGNSQFFTIMPGEVRSDGAAVYNRTLVGIKRGDFLITAWLMGG